MKKTSPLPRRRPIAYLTQEETKRLFAATKTHKRDRALFLIAYRHGLRASEVGALHRTDFDPTRGRLTIQRLKNSIDGVHPMKADEIKILRAYLRERADSLPYLFPSNRNVPIDRRTLWLAMQNYAKRAGIPPDKRKFHALRHSIATHLLDAGADISFVRDWLGHADIKNTTIYAKLTNPRRDEEARRIFQSHRVV